MSKKPFFEKRNEQIMNIGALISNLYKYGRYCKMRKLWGKAIKIALNKAEFIFIFVY